MGEIDFSLPVKHANECRPCPFCGEPWCEECKKHYADCAHPGPHSEPEEADALTKPEGE